MTFEYLQIEYASPDNHDDLIVVNYRLRQHPVVGKWIDCLLRAQQQYQIDEPDRFYGFGPLQDQITNALFEINSLADFIDGYCQIPIRRRLTDVNDQDTLNYLHHIFEINHGLLNAKIDTTQAQAALSKLNIAVHRCESIQRGALPRHVVTYFGLPKEQQLANEDYQHFETATKFGTVYLNYAEIGKTLEDLAADNDQYIHNNAFQPFKNYSADFVVRFWESSNLEHVEHAIKYFNQHHVVFNQLGYEWNDLEKSLGSIPLADIVDTDRVLEQLASRQYVKSVKLF
jgi:hypothetical protein